MNSVKLKVKRPEHAHIAEPFIILQALQHISAVRYYGISVMLDVLRGVKTPKLFNAKLEEIPEYGALKDISSEELKIIVEWMITNHFMLKTRGSIRCCIRHMMECIMRKR